MMLTRWLNSTARSVGRWAYGSSTLRTRARTVEAVGFGILIVALMLVWLPLGLFLVGGAIFTWAQFMRGREE